MPKATVSRKRALYFAAILFGIGLVFLVINKNWWPGIMLAIGLPFALRQYLLGRTYDAAISFIVFVGTFITVNYDISWQVFLPILLTLGAIYLLFREFIEVQEESEAEREEDFNHELEEKKRK